MARLSQVGPPSVGRPLPSGDGAPLADDEPGAVVIAGIGRLDRRFLCVKKPDIDFFTLDEAVRLLAGAERDPWYVMMTMRYARLAPDVSREAVKLLDAPAPRALASGAA